MNFDQLKSTLEGDLFIDNVQRVLYSTDASQYKEMPLAVTKPKSAADIKKIISFTRENNTSLIPRGGGTFKPVFSYNLKIQLSLLDFYNYIN
jgi:FAD/FMN-containing dehydrogenase